MPPDSEERECACTKVEERTGLEARHGLWVPAPHLDKPPLTLNRGERAALEVSRTVYRKLVFCLHCRRYALSLYKESFGVYADRDRRRGWCPLVQFAVRGIVLVLLA